MPKYATASDVDPDPHGSALKETFWIRINMLFSLFVYLNATSVNCYRSRTKTFGCFSIQKPRLRDSSANPGPVCLWGLILCCVCVSGPGASAEPGLHGVPAREAEPKLPQDAGADPGEAARPPSWRGAIQPGLTSLLLNFLLTVLFSGLI